MRILRALNPLVIGMLLDNMTVDTLIDPALVANETMAAMINDPENTGVFVILDGEDAKGFVTCWKEPNRPWLWIDQAYINPELPLVIKTELLDTVTDFAHSLGCTQLRAETQRNLEAWNKRYGFEEHSIIMKKDI